MELAQIPPMNNFVMSDSSDKQQPIDKLRNSAFSIEIHTPEDESTISEMISTGDQLFVVKGKGIYEVKLADQVDPDRTNIHVPNTVQKIIPYGADEPWIGSVVLTAHIVSSRVRIPQIVSMERKRLPWFSELLKNSRATINW